MADASRIIAILNFEEGYRANPYIDTEGYPTVAVGIRIGPKGASLSNYTFSVPLAVSDVWTDQMVKAKQAEMQKYTAIASALKLCNPARVDALTCMAYQLGVGGLAGFKQTLARVAAGDFTGAAAGMLDSLWARQTPKRAQRVAALMRSGNYDAYKGLI